MFTVVMSLQLPIDVVCWCMCPHTQSYREWRAAIDYMDDSHRIMLYDLASVGKGYYIKPGTWSFGLSGLWERLEPHLSMARNHHYYLTSPVQRQMILVRLDHGDNLIGC